MRETLHLRCRSSERRCLKWSQARGFSGPHGSDVTGVLVHQSRLGSNSDATPINTRVGRSRLEFDLMMCVGATPMSKQPRSRGMIYLDCSQAHVDRCGSKRKPFDQIVLGLVSDGQEVHVWLSLGKRANGACAGPQTVLVQPSEVLKTSCESDFFGPPSETSSFRGSARK